MASLGRTAPPPPFAALVRSFAALLKPAPRTRPGSRYDRGRPGLRPFTALVMLAEIGGVSRSGSARKQASWAELIGRPRLQHALLAVASPAGRPVHVTEAHRLPG